MINRRYQSIDERDKQGTQKDPEWWQNEKFSLTETIEMVQGRIGETLSTIDELNKALMEMKMTESLLQDRLIYVESKL